MKSIWSKMCPKSQAFKAYCLFARFLGLRRPTDLFWNIMEPANSHRPSYTSNLLSHIVSVLTIFRTCKDGPQLQPRPAQTLLKTFDTLRFALVVASAKLENIPEIWQPKAPYPSVGKHGSVQGIETAVSSSLRNDYCPGTRKRRRGMPGDGPLIN